MEAAGFRPGRRWRSLRLRKQRRGNRHLSTAVGDEGGFAPDLPSNEAAMEVICEAVEKAGYTAGKDIVLAADVAASELLGDDG